ncbi:hypothetical protein B0J14DRAFT_637697 [Halenospora varia]|nr:hypothetical protein B0J14DRAFT_637697 [Halenospora varia]
MAGHQRDGSYGSSHPRGASNKEDQIFEVAPADWNGMKSSCTRKELRDFFLSVKKSHVDPAIIDAELDKEYAHQAGKRAEYRRPTGARARTRSPPPSNNFNSSDYAYEKEDAYASPPHRAPSSEPAADGFYSEDESDRGSFYDEKSSRTSSTYSRKTSFDDERVFKNVFSGTRWERHSDEDDPPRARRSTRSAARDFSDDDYYSGRSSYTIRSTFSGGVHHENALPRRSHYTEPAPTYEPKEDYEHRTRRYMRRRYTRDEAEISDSDHRRGRYRDDPTPTSGFSYRDTPSHSTTSASSGSPHHSRSHSARQSNQHSSASYSRSYGSGYYPPSFMAKDERYERHIRNGMRYSRSSRAGTEARLPRIYRNTEY